MNNRIALLAALSTSVVVSMPLAKADGLMDRGHIRGPHTDLTLTADQIAHLKRGEARVTLTQEQRNILLKVGPKAAKVTSLIVLPRDTSTCTCELTDIAVRVSTSKIEVANELLGRDLEAEARAFEKFIKTKEDELRKKTEAPE